jgi:hypothetical protein
MYFWGGLIAAWLVIIDTHSAVWLPYFFGGHISSTGAINFLFGPIFAVGYLVVGMIVGYILSWLKDLTDAAYKKLKGE